ncbi:hypothetical protein WA171_006270 [Blastocystis sp. BT1]
MTIHGNLLLVWCTVSIILSIGLINSRKYTRIGWSMDQEGMYLRHDVSRGSSVTSPPVLHNSTNRFITVGNTTNQYERENQTVIEERIIDLPANHLILKIRLRMM